MRAHTQSFRRYLAFATLPHRDKADALAAAAVAAEAARAQGGAGAAAAGEKGGSEAAFVAGGVVVE